MTFATLGSLQLAASETKWVATSFGAPGELVKIVVEAVVGAVVWQVPSNVPIIVRHVISHQTLTTWDHDGSKPLIAHLVGSSRRGLAADRTIAF